jgi:Family of unknown function (DUF5906)
MPTPEQWRAFLRVHGTAVRNIRLQSQAFVRGENLAVLPLQFMSKSLSSDNSPEFANWADIDYPLMINFGAKMPPRTGSHAVVDLDADLKPISGEWTDELEAQAAAILKDLLDMIVAIGGIDGRHRWGRASRGCDGHVYIPVEFVDRAGLTMLLSLSMRKAITVGPFKLRIEVRVAPDAKTPSKKPFTLPGSVYPTPQGGFDLIGWHTYVSDLAPLQAFPRLSYEPLQKLVKGLWAGLLYASLYDHWGDGNRHDTGLLAAGVLVREADEQTGFLDESDAREIMQRLSDAFGDENPSDRMRGLENTFATVRQNRPITGYARLAELIGDEAKFALLRARGGGDPDAYAALLDLIAYVPDANGKEDVWIDLSTGGHGTVICSKSALINHFHPHPHYPVHVGPKGKQYPLIGMVTDSPRLQRYHGAVNLPGVPFRTVLIKEGDAYRDATESEIADPTSHKLLNIGPGYRTPLVDDISDVAWERFYQLWRRHLRSLTSGNPAAIEKVEKAIAWAAQRPLEKIPLGLCFTGGGGIGKSVLFAHILSQIFGSHVVKFSNVLNLESQFRLADLEGAKFYVIEEVNLNHASVAIKELLKDLMKNTRMKINRKYGAENYVENFCIPCFLTNETNPGIVIQGQRERSLVLIQGETRENQGWSLEEWTAYRNRIADFVNEFIEALKDPAIREAGMAYFWNIDVERRDFEDNSELGDLADPRDNMDPIDEAIVGILEANELHPKFKGDTPLTVPFKMDWLVAGIHYQLQQRNVSRKKLTAHGVSKAMNRILKDGKNELFRDIAFKDSSHKTRHMRYIACRYGDMIAHAERALGIPLEPAYEPQEEDYGPNEPTAEDCRRAWELPFFSVGSTAY